ncbi:MAG: quinone-dependent dihydroorotate dehydrogenase [Chitinophagaceae bacterium]|nr:quinone-dependent dihydroorotate dehydrogenase [Chitinophagaceae bacterium]
MYRFIRQILFLMPPEKVHYFSMNGLHFLCSIGFKKILTRRFTPRQAEPFELWNLQFRNRIGLGAGFDKNARYLRELEVLGFGFVEIGTVTPLPQAGNEKPRLFRLPKDKALINRMGFNNDGVVKIAERLKKWKAKNHSVMIGGNIGKNKITPNEDAWQDYGKCFTALFPVVDYFVVNVSSPNTPGLRALQEKDALQKILLHLQNLNQQQPNQKPILLKIAPDLSQAQLDDIIDLAKNIQLDGLVATNTSITREGLKTSAQQIEKIGHGGLSGQPIREMSTAVLQYICKQTNNKMPVIASGGIFTGEDADEKLKTGAALLQVWTGFIYQGPGIIKNIYKKIHA